jgi:hypothetical protein
MSLEQTIRSTMTEAMDMDGRLDQLVRAGLMPTSSLPLLKRAISRMHAGMSLQGAERDVMNMFISSMMFIVLGDDTVFNKARAGAKGYATEEVDLDENASVVAHLTKRYGDNIRKSHVMSAAKDFGVDPSKLSKAVRKKLGKSMLDEAKEKTEYDYEGDMAMGQLKSIIANSQRMHDMLSDDTNLPEWVQSKITLAEDYISTASNYMQGEMNEEKMPFEGPYRKVGERKDKYGNTVKNVPKFLAKKAMNKQKNEEVEQIDEILPLVAGAAARYAAGKAGAGVVGRTVAGAATKYAVSKSMNKEEIDPDLEAELKATRVTKKSMEDSKKTRERASGVKEEADYSEKGDAERIRKRQEGWQKTFDAEKAMQKKAAAIKHANEFLKRYNKEEVEGLDEEGYVSKTPPTARTLKPEVKPTMNPAFKPKTRQSSVGTLARVRSGMAKRLNNGNVKEDIDAVKQMNESYKTAFETALNEYGIKSPSELDESKRKEFFNHVDLEFKKGDN